MVITMKSALLLLNLGTPEQPEPAYIKRYLQEFLLDERVLDINPISRNILVRGIIAPRRSKPLAENYKEIWTDQGSPLLKYTKNITDKLQEDLGKEWLVKFAMRYQSPSIESVLKKLEAEPLRELIILPLYPQYASATTGSSLEKVFTVLSKWKTIPQTRVISHFCDHPAFIESYAEAINQVLFSHKDPFEKLIISFHSLPERQLKKAHSSCLSESCCSSEKQCYKAHCIRTYNALLKQLQRTSENTLLTFQSRFGKDPWIGPETLSTVQKLGKNGIKRIAIVSPSFVADCIETIYELGHEVRDAFIESGGTNCQIIPALNDSTAWSKALQRIAFNG